MNVHQIAAIGRNAVYQYVKLCNGKKLKLKQVAAAMKPAGYTHCQVTNYLRYLSGRAHLRWRHGSYWWDPNCLPYPGTVAQGQSGEKTKVKEPWKQACQSQSETRQIQTMDEMYLEQASERDRAA